MMKIFSAIIALLISFNISAQTKVVFDIRETILPNSLKSMTAEGYRNQSQSFFEDEKYSVSKTCSGEWGGTIKFKNKMTGIEYSCSATCPVVVNKVNGTYIITNTLAHMSGSTEIIEVRNPDSLTISQKPKPSKNKRKMIIRHVGDDESKSTKGAHKLADSIGILTLATFSFNQQLFHIVTDFRKTFVTRIENGKFVTLEIASNESIWTYNPEVIRTENGRSIVFFSNEKLKGYLEIVNNQINIVKYK